MFRNDLEQVSFTRALLRILTYAFVLCCMALGLLATLNAIGENADAAELSHRPKGEMFVAVLR